MQPLSRTHYFALGAIMLICGLPGLVALVTGQLGPGGNPYIPFTLTGIPLGGLFIAYGRDRFPRRQLADLAVRAGWLSLFQLVFLVGAWLMVRAGRLGFETAFGFFAMAASFFSVLALALLVYAAVNRPETRTD